MNKVILIGNLGQDPETRTLDNDSIVTNFSIATNERWTKDGVKQEHVEWHKVVVWGNLAEVCGRYLRKGSKVSIDGKIQTRKWEDKEGNTRYTTEIKAAGVEFLDPKPKEPTNVDGSPDEDLPF